MDWPSIFVATWSTGRKLIIMDVKSYHFIGTYTNISRGQAILDEIHNLVCLFNWTLRRVVLEWQESPIPHLSFIWRMGWLPRKKKGHIIDHKYQFISNTSFLRWIIVPNRRQVKLSLNLIDIWNQYPLLNCRMDHFVNCFNHLLSSILINNLWRRNQTLKTTFTLHMSCKAWLWVISF